MMKFLSLLFFSITCTFISAQEDFELKETYPIQATETLYLDTEDADVVIKTTDRSDVLVDIKRTVKGKVKTNKEFDIEIYEKDGDLVVKEKRQKGTYSYSMVFGSVSYKVYVELPEGVSLDIKGEDDSYDISDIVGNISIDTEDGDIVINRQRMGDVDLTLEDGDVELTDINGNLNINLEDGDVVIEESDLQTADFVLEDGDVGIYGSAIGKLITRNEDGNVKIKKCDLHSVKMKTEDGDISIVSRLFGDSDFDIQAGDGNVDIVTNGMGYKAMVSFEDGDVDYGSNYNITADKKRYKEVHTRSVGSAIINVDLQDGDLYLKHVE